MVAASGSSDRYTPSSGLSSVQLIVYTESYTTALFLPETVAVRVVAGSTVGPGGGGMCEAIDQQTCNVNI